MTARIKLDDLTSDQYDELCDDLDEYERVQGDMNERAIDLTRRAETAEKELREVRWRAEDAERKARCQRERAERAEAALVRPGLVPDDNPATDTDPAPATPGQRTDPLADLYARWVKAGPPPLGQSISRWWDRRLAELGAALGEEQQGVHRYLSTGCLHGDHDYCKAMTGLNGAKRPGECKHCGAKCTCGCHAAEERPVAF